MMKFNVAIFASLFVLTLAVANVAEEKKPTTTTTTATTTTTTKPAATTVKLTAPTVKDLKTEDTTEGKGKVAAKGKTVKVNYTGWLYDSKAPKNRGKQFDTSVGKEPFTFTLGAGSVIKGWDEGFSNMKVGGKRVITIPSEMGYGARGAGDVIPPNAPLVFEVELLDVMETSTN
jgi:FKBP-type peptidyl-prolyl cis-trans isomerase FkpA